MNAVCPDWSFAGGPEHRRGHAWTLRLRSWRRAFPTVAADPRTARTGAIVRAAGRSRRFGSANKLLVPPRGEPLLWHTLDAVCASRARPIIVVLGHQHQRLRETLRRYRRARRAPPIRCVFNRWHRSEEHTSELQSLMRISYAVFCLKKKIAQ